MRDSHFISEQIEGVKNTPFNCIVEYKDISSCHRNLDRPLFHHIKSTGMTQRPDGQVRRCLHCIYGFQFDKETLEDPYEMDLAVGGEHIPHSKKIKPDGIWHMLDIPVVVSRLSFSEIILRCDKLKNGTYSMDCMIAGFS